MNYAHIIFHLFLIIFLCIYSANAQITNSPSSGRNDARTAQVDQAEAQIKRVTDDAGRYFKQALLHLKDNKRADARVEFNKSVEVFLLSGIDVNRNQGLRECYSQLIETVYRIEFPSNKQPANIRSLSATCNWEIKNELADDIAKKILIMPSENDPNAVVGSTNEGLPEETLIGFSEQKFEVSPLDELSKLVLEDEKDKFIKEVVKPQPRSAGVKPNQQRNGTVPLVIRYIADTFHDPYSVKYLKWSKLKLVTFRNQNLWMVELKLRAKNLYNAYRLATLYFYILNNKVVYADESELLALDNGLFSEQSKDTVQVTPSSNIKIVKAQAGDTVKTLARRHGANALEVAKLNGLLVNSKLPAGRDVRIPVK